VVGFGGGDSSSENNLRAAGGGVGYNGGDASVESSACSRERVGVLRPVLFVGLKLGQSAFCPLAKGLGASIQCAGTNEGVVAKWVSLWTVVAAAAAVDSSIRTSRTGTA
jgi:hypothetical protein